MKIKINTADSVDWEATGVRQLKNNVLNLVRTRRGEIHFMPPVGLNPDYVGRPASVVEGDLYNDIADQLAQWEPTAKLDSLSVAADQYGNLEVEVNIT